MQEYNISENSSWLAQQIAFKKQCLCLFSQGSLMGSGINFLSLNLSDSLVLWGRRLSDWGYRSSDLVLLLWALRDKCREAFGIILYTE